MRALSVANIIVKRDVFIKNVLWRFWQGILRGARGFHPGDVVSSFLLVPGALLLRLACAAFGAACRVSRFQRRRLSINVFAAVVRSRASGDRAVLCVVFQKLKEECYEQWELE